MIEIVGGTYREICYEPDWSALYGSGLRATAALTELSPNLGFHTFVGVPEKENLEHLAASFAFRLATCETIDQTVSFVYEHALAVPRITPAPHTLRDKHLLHVNAENILRFGMLEGDAVVRGKRVVYDPQSAFDPCWFEANGSSAESLAVVANLGEWKKLTRTANHTELSAWLRKECGSKVFVVKMGCRGAMVVDSSGTEVVPAFETERVFPIGSGDVFAAAFAHYWCEGRLAPQEAALLASKSAANYCCSRTLPIPRDLSATDRFAPLPTRPLENASVSHDFQVYLAGPFFNFAQRWLIDQARETLQDHGLRVFSPLHDVGRGEAEDVAKKDIEGLENSKLVFAVVDGLDPGTLFEIGYARARGIPVMVFVQAEKPEDMKMLRGMDCVVCNDFATCVYRAAWMGLKA
ncbi:MAG TPA: PfkB family carbohydrate kinase [Phycisphaerae bacterium]|nr:PfkB family carbohydrate kinase [Phycisphaerae bacterium]